MEFLRSISRRMGRAYIRHTPIEKGKSRLIHQVLKPLDHEPGSTILHEIKPNIRMYLDLDSLIDRYVYYTGFYRPWALHYFDTLLCPGMTVIDVGANIGCYALWAALRVGSTGKVFAFEPEPGCFDQLRRNIEVNGITWIDARRLAIADVDGESALNMNDPRHPNRGQSSLAALKFHRRAMTVETARLDSLTPSRSMRGLDVLKIDTQGSELRVLRGARRLLEEFKPSLLLRLCEEKCAAEGCGSKDPQQLLFDLGYRLFEVLGGTEYGARLSRTSLQEVQSPRVVFDSTFIAKSNGT